MFLFLLNIWFSKALETTGLWTGAGRDTDDTQSYTPDLAIPMALPTKALSFESADTRRHQYQGVPKTRIPDVKADKGLSTKSAEVEGQPKKSEMESGSSSVKPADDKKPGVVEPTEPTIKPTDDKKPGVVKPTEPTIKPTDDKKPGVVEPTEPTIKRTDDKKPGVTIKRTNDKKPGVVEPTEEEEGTQEKHISLFVL